jgi:hypothetical protein
MKLALIGLVGVAYCQSLYEYSVNTEKRTWYEAKQVCEKIEGGSLLSIQSEKQNKQIIDILKSNPIDQYWMGLNIKCPNYN